MNILAGRKIKEYLEKKTDISIVFQISHTSLPTIKAVNKWIVCFIITS